MSTAVTTPLVEAIETVWSAIQAQHNDVPEVVVTLGSGSAKKGMKLGHFAAHRGPVLLQLSQTDK